jgi:hypothetical protein
MPKAGKPSGAGSSDLTFCVVPREIYPPGLMFNPYHLFLALGSVVYALILLLNLLIAKLSSYQHRDTEKEFANSKVKYLEISNC